MFISKNIVVSSVATMSIIDAINEFHQRFTPPAHCKSHHIQFCNDNNKQYFNFIAHFYEKRNLISYVWFDEFALFEFIENDFYLYRAEHESLPNYVHTTPFKHVYFAELNNELHYAPFSNYFNFVCDELHVKTVDGTELFKYEIWKKPVKRCPEMAHICFCALPTYVSHCKKLSEKQKMRVVMIYDELQVGTEMHLLADEYVVFNIVKFL